ncbi:hypothetical protein SESBI_47424 [Sesbania bispinosa]|nr:hypothetical protein SESBI_47424 [Sesbania bispinosa]
MESREYKRSAQPYKNSVPQDETMNLPFPPPRFSPKQAHHNFGSTPSSQLNPVAGSSHNPTWWEIQAQRYALSLLSSQHQDFPSTKKQQSNMVLGNGKDAKKGVHENRGIASHHFEASVNASGTNPQLENLEADGTKKGRKRHTNKESAKESIRKWKQEREGLQRTLDHLKEELIEKYGQEQVADLLNMKPT